MKKRLLPLALLAGLCGCLAGTAQADQSVELLWQVPVERVNGNAITVDELGGYEIRMVHEASGERKSVVIPHGDVTGYRMDGLRDGELVFEIAAFDSEGLYSEFVGIRYTRPSAPSVPGVPSARPVRNDVVAACLADPNCKVAVAGEW